MDGVSIQPHQSTTITQVANLHPSELRRRTLQALNTRDPEWLWSVVTAHMELYGKAGGKTSAHTRKAYHQGMLLLLKANFDLIHPNRDDGAIWIRQLEAQGLTPSTVNVRLAAARAAYRAWLWAGAVESNPFLDVQAIADTSDRTLKRKPYTEDELDLLLQISTPKLKALLLLCAHGGLRIAEALAITWEDLDLRKGTIAVQSGKGRKPRETFISERLEKVLVGFPEKTGRLFDWDDQAARYQIRKVAQAAEVDIKGRVFHGFRHQAGTRLYQENKDLNMVASYLGHANINTTRIYAKVDQASTKTRVRKW